MKNKLKLNSQYIKCCRIKLKKLKEKEKKDPSPPELASQICDLIMR
jgi:hypothetical protein